MKYKKRAEKKVDFTRWAQWAVWCYLAAMLGAFPLFVRNGYFDIGEAKYLFFRTAALMLLSELALIHIFDRLLGDGSGGRAIWPNRSAVDAAALAYAGAAALSWALSPYRAQAFIGSPDWYMGMLSQLLFVGIYFAISRSGSVQKPLLWIGAGGGAAAFLIAWLHRFNIDPLGLYQEIGPDDRIGFLGTIGNATWHSSYLCVALPVMMGFFILPRMRRWERSACGSALFLGFCTAVTQNSDSIYVGLGLAFLFLGWHALEEPGTWRRYAQTALLAALAARLTGILQGAFGERAHSLGALSTAISRGRGGWAALAAAAIVWALAVWADNKRAGAWPDPTARLLRLARAFFALLLLLGALALAALLWKANAGGAKGPSGILAKSGYLAFDEGWGNGRGKIWSYCARVFLEYPLPFKLFGCGPDALAYYSAEFHEEEALALWEGYRLTNAHNEWLTALVCCGVAGFAAYAAIFAAAFIRAFRNRKRCPLLLAAGAAVLSYAGHNFFCYQQSVCTPLIFIVIGAAEYQIRKA